MSEPNSKPWIWAVYVTLFAAAIPWYLPQEFGQTIWFGFPMWVSISFLATLSIALFTVFVIHFYWSDQE